jgi:putative cofactor-binding repeat protein
MTRPSHLIRAMSVVLVMLVVPASAAAQSATWHTTLKPRHRHATRQDAHKRTHSPRNVPSSGSQVASVAAGAITGTTYYVSPNGSDSNRGTSPDDAWRTIGQVNRAKLQPGDGVLFQGGASFTDNTLMPGWGTSVSGSPDHPVVFGSFGQGHASLPEGIWIKGEHNLEFDSLDLGPQQGLSGTGDAIVVEGCSMTNLTGEMNIGVNAIGSNWTIRDNRIDHTGNSGMLLRGDNFVVANNTITNTGTDNSISYGTHGIYLKASNSTVTGNTIDHFRDDGISVRYRNSTISANTISNGAIGIAWFQYDGVSGTSRWTRNTIIADRDVGIYVSPSDQGGATRESFVISGNRIAKPASTAGWQALNLHATSGRYSVFGNVVR